MTGTSNRRKVLITGAGGTIGTSLTAHLQDTYDLRLLYHRSPASPSGDDYAVADIRNLDALLPVMEGIDTVLHLAGDPRVPASWESVYENNIGGTYCVLEAARQAGVRRVVFASTNHVMGMHDVKGDWPVYNGMPQRPDSYYGVSKACGEDLGRFYHDKWDLDFIALRIGWFLKDPARASGDIGRAMWLSPRDCAHAFTCAIETEVKWGVYYAISNNPNRRWDITDALVEIGYRPQDSWDRATDTQEAIAPGQHVPAERWTEAE